MVERKQISFDTSFYRRKLTIKLNEEQKFLQGESEIVKTIYSILATSKEKEDKLRIISRHKTKRCTEYKGQ